MKDWSENPLPAAVINFASQPKFFSFAETAGPRGRQRFMVAAVNIGVVRNTVTAGLNHRFYSVIKHRSMYEILNRYLFQHKRISIPGLGSLVAETIPAVSDFANRQLLPVQLKFRFDKYFDVPEKSFFAYLSQKKNIADFEAMRWYNDFAAALNNKIKTEEEAVWQGVGIFKKDFGGEVIFEPYALPYELYPPVQAERIIRADAKHSILVGDKQKTNYEMTEMLNDGTYVEKESWWIYALILAAIGLCLLFFHFYRNNMSWRTGNQQHISIDKPAN